MSADLSPAEYDFRSVPDSSLRDCCLYEYLREGELQRWHVARMVQANLLWALRWRRPLPEDANVLLLALTARLPSKWFGTPKKGLAKPFVPSVPWLELTAEKQAIARLALNAFGRNLPAIPAIAPVLVGDLDFWLGGQSLIDAASSHANPSQRRPIEESLAIDGGSVFFAVRVNLKGATNEEILSAFKKRLDESRACFELEEPQKAGHSFARQRTLLDNLGILRLRHVLKRDAVVRTLAQINLYIGNPADGDVATALDKRGARAVAYFKEISFDLPEEARPASHLTKSQVENGKPPRGVLPLNVRGPFGQKLR